MLKTIWWSVYNVQSMTIKETKELLILFKELQTVNHDVSDIDNQIRQIDVYQSIIQIMYNNITDKKEEFMLYVDNIREPEDQATLFQEYFWKSEKKMV